MHITRARRRASGGELNIAAVLIARFEAVAAQVDAPAPTFFHQSASPASRPAPVAAASAPASMPRAAAELPLLSSPGIPAARVEPSRTMPRMEAPAAPLGEPPASWWQGLCGLGKGFR